MNRDWVLAKIQSLQLPREDGCYDWIGVKSSYNYPILYVEGRPYRVNRLVVSIKYNLDINDNFYAMHSCDFPPCTNEEHLRPGSAKENSIDIVKKGRHPNKQKTHCKYGHEYSYSNTRIEGNKRHCRICHRDAARRQQDKKKRNKLK